MHHLTDRITHTTAFVTPVMEQWLETSNGTDYYSSSWANIAISRYLNTHLKGYCVLLYFKRTDVIYIYMNERKVI